VWCIDLYDVWVVVVCSFASFDGAESWPTGVRHVYLDGNNMLFVTGAIRSAALKSMKRAEAALSGVAREFAGVLYRAGKLDSCVLVFDNAHRENVTVAAPSSVVAPQHKPMFAVDSGKLLP
jgi:hypothetical protein